MMIILDQFHPTFSFTSCDSKCSFLLSLMAYKQNINKIKAISTFLNIRLFQLLLQQKRQRYKMKLNCENVLEVQKQPLFQVQSDQYNNYRNEMEFAIMDDITAAKLFKIHEIEYDSQKPFRQFTYDIINTFQKYQILKIRIFLGYFEMEALVLNLNTQNPQKIYFNQLGKHGSLYISICQGKQFIVKSIPYGENTFIRNLQKVLLEWSILKICSVLQCAPKMENYFGFDIIVYENCFQIAMEKGIKINSLSKPWYKQLKQQLQIMHRFHIIHCDIKPDNIIFSPQYNKVVFIDFGFSSIISQNIGHKKRTIFKGSAGYCIEQMLNLFSLQATFGYVDLYYNDLYGLNTTYSQMRFEAIGNNGFFKQQQEENASSVHQIAANQLSQVYLLYRFKYYYVQQNLEAFKSIFLNLSLIKTIRIQILKFIKDIFHEVYIADVFQTYLKNLCSIDQFQQISRLLNRQQSRIRIHMTHQQPEEHFLQEQINFTDKYKNILVQNQSTSTLSQIQVCFEYLISKQITQPTQSILHVLFQCIRFNIQNLSFAEKVKIACKWSKILVKDDKQENNNPLGNIISIFQYFLNYCDEEPFNEWKKQNIFEVSYNSVILGIEVHVIQNLLYKRLNNSYYNTVTYKLVLQTSLAQFIERLEVLDLISSTNRPILTLLQFANSKNQILMDQISRLDSANYGIQEQVLLHINEQIKTSCEWNNLQKVAELINKVKNKRLQSNFMKQLTYRRLIYESQNTFNDLSLKNIRSLIKFDSALNIDIHLIFKFSDLYLTKLELYSEFKKMGELMKAIISCETVYSRLNIDKYIFVIDFNKKDKKLIIQYLKQIQQNYSLLKSLNLPVQRHLYFLLKKIDNLQFFSQQEKALIMCLYNNFSLHNQNLIKNFSKNSFTDYQNIFIQSNIQKLFLKLLPQLLNLLAQKIIRIKQQIQLKKLHVLDSSNKFMVDSDHQCPQLTYYIQLQFYYNLLKEDYQGKCANYREKLACLIRLAQISEKLCLKNLFDYFCYKVTLFSNFVAQEQVFCHFIELNFKIALLFKSTLAYLFKSKKYILIYTLQYFKMKSEQKLFLLLELILQQIKHNPLQPYIAVYLEVMQKFYEYYPDFFTYKSIRLNFIKIKENPYLSIFYILAACLQKDECTRIKILKLISLFLPKLSCFTKQKILLKYNRIILRLQSVKKRQVKMYLFRSCKAFLSQKPYFNYLKRQSKKLNRNKSKPFINKIYSKLSALI